MENRSKIVFALAGLAVVCIILTCGCTTQSATTDSTGSSGVPSSSEEITVDTPDEIPVEPPVETPANTPAEPPADMPADAAGTGGSPQGGMPPQDLSEMTTEEIQAMLDMMQADGIDTTEAEAALEEGDLDAVMAFMEANRPADGGQGGRPDGPPPQ